MVSLQRVSYRTWSTPFAVWNKNGEHQVPIGFLSGAAGSTHNLVLDCNEMVLRIREAFNKTLLPLISIRFVPGLPKQTVC